MCIVSDCTVDLWVNVRCESVDPSWKCEAVFAAWLLNEP